jgi:hypothetical protein
MQPIAFDERQREAGCERLTDRRLAAAADAHDYYHQRVGE